MNVDTVPLSDWLPYVQPDLPGCPSLLVTDALWRAADEFCRKSWYWTVDLDPIGVLANVADYQVDDTLLPDQTKLVKLLYLTGQDSLGTAVQILPKALDWILYNVYDWKNQSSDDLAYFISRSKDTATLVPYPATTRAEILTFTVAVAPDNSATEVGQVLWDDYREAITAGAKALRMMDAGRKWSNPSMAEMLAMRFQQDAKDARNTIENGYNRPNLQVRTCYDIR